MQYQELSLDQIRYAIQFIHRNAKAAMDADAADLAQCLMDTAESLFAEMVRRIRIADPHTTEADIRYFEGV
jgi:hypothetical protein